MPNITLVLLGRNDDDNEMANMVKAIQATLLSHQHVVTTLEEPDVRQVPQDDEVWLCGHCRFVEANSSIRKKDQRNLGGFPLAEVATFVNDCILDQGVTTIRLICCESAQHGSGGRLPGAAPPAQGPFARALGTETIVPLTKGLIDAFENPVDQHVSHLEHLLLCMSDAWNATGRRKGSFPGFTISGLWGAGDVEQGQPITSFLQQGGGLEAVQKLAKNPNDKHAKRNFDRLHCANQNLPDLFGYQVPADFFLNVDRNKKVWVVEFKCRESKNNPFTLKCRIPERGQSIGSTFWSNRQSHVRYPVCPVRNHRNCIVAELTQKSLGEAFDVQLDLDDPQFYN